MQEKDALVVLPAQLEEQIQKIILLCNCESDGIRTKTATIQVLLNDIPNSLQERLNLLMDVEKHHTRFSGLVNDRITWLLHLEKQIRNTSYITFDTASTVRKEMSNMKSTLNAKNSQIEEINDLFTELEYLAHANDVVVLRDRVAESNQLYERMYSTVDARIKCSDLLLSLHEMLTPIRVQIEAFRTTIEKNNLASKEMIDDCNNIGVDLVDCLKIAIQFDTQAQSGHIHFKYNGDICLAKQLIATVDSEVESILSFASTQNDTKSVITAAFDNLKRRAEDFQNKLNLYHKDIETMNIDDMEFNVASRQVQQIIDSIATLKKIELKSIKLKASSLVDEQPELKIEADELIERLIKSVNAAEDDFVDFKYRISDLFDARSSHESDMTDVRKMLDSIAKFLESIGDLDGAPNILGRLRQSRDDLEQNQEKANRLKNSKYEIKSKSRDLNATLADQDSGSDSGSSTMSSIDNLTDRYMDLQDQIEEAIDQYETLAKLEEDVSVFDETIDDWSRKTIHDLNASLDDSTKLQQTMNGLSDTLSLKSDQLKNFEKLMLNPDQSLLSNSQPNEKLKSVTKDIARKLDRVQHAHENALIRLENFDAERDRLIRYVTELETWIATKENTLLTIEKTLRVENISKCKEVNVELLTQRENIEQTKDHLNGLCRQYHASDKLQDLTESVTNLVKKYESICRLSARVLNKLEAHLSEQYNVSQERFLIWKKHAAEVINDCQDVTGEPHEIESKINQLKSIIEDQPKVEGWLSELSENTKCDIDGGKIQEQLTKHQNEFKGIIREANHFHKVLNDAAVYVKTLDDNRTELQKWLDDISKKLGELQGETNSLDEVNIKLDRLRGLQNQLNIKQQAFEGMV